MDIEAELKSWEVPTQLEALACDRRIEALKDEKAALPRQHIGKAAEEFIRMRGLELDAEIDRETGDASSWRCRSEFFGKGVFLMDPSVMHDSQYMAKTQSLYSRAHKAGRVYNSTEALKGVGPE
jgi:hypothetical protein